MPNTKSAAKAIRQTQKRTLRNRKIMAEVEINLRLARRAITAQSNEAAKLVAIAVKKLDKAWQKGVMKKNTVSRLKSRLIKYWQKNK